MCASIYMYLHTAHGTSQLPCLVWPCITADFRKSHVKFDGEVATDWSICVQIYWLAKQCSERCSPEEFAVTVAKHLVTKYEKVGHSRAASNSAGLQMDCVYLNKIKE